MTVGSIPVGKWLVHEEGVVTHTHRLRHPCIPCIHASRDSTHSAGALCMYTHKLTDEAANGVTPMRKFPARTQTNIETDTYTVTIEAHAQLT